MFKMAISVDGGAKLPIEEGSLKISRIVGRKYFGSPNNMQDVTPKGTHTIDFTLAKTAQDVSCLSGEIKSCTFYSYDNVYEFKEVALVNPDEHHKGMKQYELSGTAMDHYPSLP